MKTIFRYANFGLLLAVILAMGAVAGFAQDACSDDEATATARNAAGDKVREDFGVYGTTKNLDDKGKIIDNAKAFLDKYQACAQAKDLVDYLKQYLPGMETGLQQARAKAEEDAYVKPFIAALDAKNWDEVMASGKRLLAKYPEKFRTVEIVLAALAGEEAIKNNFKYADDGIRFGKASIADLEAGKSFIVGKDTQYGMWKKGVYNFGFTTKEDALGWLNLYVGHITAVGQKNKSGALPYLYKASQAVGSDTSKRSLPYDLIGAYYFDELGKVIEEIKALIESQKPEDDEATAKQKVDAIKAKEAFSFGLAERAMDAFARAHKIEKDPAVSARLKANVEKAYFVRFAKKEGVDAWIASAVTKPFVNPTTPVAPITDPVPTATTSTVTTPAATTAPKTTTTTPAGTKPAASPATKPAAQPAGKATGGTKPQATVKKPIKRKAV